MLVCSVAGLMSPNPNAEAVVEVLKAFRYLAPWKASQIHAMAGGQNGGWAFYI